jgi:peptide/nickel transport system ATP-binding protein
MSILSVENLNLKIGPAKILEDVSFKLNEGRILAITGESGSGKSMTALSVIQLQPKNAKLGGKIFFRDQEITNKNELELCKIRGAKIGMIFQEPMTALNPVKTVGDQISETIVLHSKKNKTSADSETVKILERVGLNPAMDVFKRFPHELSGGQRQRVVIGIAISLKPSIIIADEPTTALDVTTQSQILALLKKLVREDNISMILITHDLAVVANMADEIAVMQNGIIVEIEETQKLFKSMKHEYTRSLFAASEHSVKLPITEANSDPLLSIKNVTCRYRLARTKVFSKSDYFTAVSDVSFDIKNGERVGLVGESGCGKSTLTRAILGLEPIFEGKINVEDVSILNAEASIRKNIQVVFQDPYGSFNPRHKVSTLIKEPFYLIRDSVDTKKIENKIEKVLEDVGLSAADKNKYIHEFSGGQRQRIAIARALIIKPKLIIFDEAVSALDVTVRAQILDLIAGLATEYGLTYLFISHDLSVIRSITDRCLVMKNGKIVEQGLTKKVLEEPQNTYTKKLIDAVPKLPNFQMEL